MSSPSSSAGSVCTGLLTILGTTLLVGFGIAICAYATSQQLSEFHSTGWDSLLFASGISLVAFKLVRRLVWLCLGLGIPWSAATVGIAYFLIGDRYRFEYTLPLAALGILPPIAAAIILEIRSGSARPIRGPHLEFNLTEHLKK